MGSSASTNLQAYKDAIHKHILKGTDAPTILKNTDDNEEIINIAQFLTSCFIGNPIENNIDALMLWIVNENGLTVADRNARLQKMALYMLCWVITPAFEKGIVLQVHDNTGERAGVAVLFPPDAWKPTIFGQINLALQYGRPPCDVMKDSWGSGTSSRFDSMNVIDSYRKRFNIEYDGFWYLQTIGTHTSARGKGYGGRLLRTICKISDYYNKCLYLETESLHNVKLYEKYQFNNIECVMLDEKSGNPYKMYLMLRKPLP